MPKCCFRWGNIRVLESHPWISQCNWDMCLEGYFFTFLEYTVTFTKIKTKIGCRKKGLAVFEDKSLFLWKKRVVIRVKMTEAAHGYGALLVSKRRDLEQTSQVSEPRNESMQTSNANGAASRSLGTIMLSQTKAHVALCHVLRGPIADL